MLDLSGMKGMHYISSLDMGLCKQRPKKFLQSILYSEKTRRGNYSVMGPTLDGRYLPVIFELKKGRIARVITGWDVKDSEKRYYRKNKGR